MTKKKATRPAPKNPGDGTTLASPSVFDELTRSGRTATDRPHVSNRPRKARA